MQPANLPAQRWILYAANKGCFKGNTQLLFASSSEDQDPQLGVVLFGGISQ